MPTHKHCEDCTVAFEQGGYGACLLTASDLKDYDVKAITQLSKMPVCTDDSHAFHYCPVCGKDLRHYWRANSALSSMQMKKQNTEEAND